MLHLIYHQNESKMMDETAKKALQKIFMNEPRNWPGCQDEPPADCHSCLVNSEKNGVVKSGLYVVHVE